MTIKADLITQFKKEFPKLTQQINDLVIELSIAEYEATIERWADDNLARDAEAARAFAAKELATTKLAALGLTVTDLKALGL